MTLERFEDGSAVLSFLWVRLIVPAFDSVGDTITVIITVGA